jgi:hypothetical protein
MESAMTASKAIRAAEAIKADPFKSDRAIARERGVNNATVSRARQRLAANATPDATPDATAGTAVANATPNVDATPPRPRCVQCGGDQRWPSNPIMETYCAGARIGWLHRFCRDHWLEANP